MARSGYAPSLHDWFCWIWGVGKCEVEWGRTPAGSSDTPEHLERIGIYKGYSSTPYIWGNVDEKGPCMCLLTSQPTIYTSYIVIYT